MGRASLRVMEGLLTAIYAAEASFAYVTLGQRFADELGAIRPIDEESPAGSGRRRTAGAAPLPPEVRDHGAGVGTRQPLSLGHELSLRRASPPSSWRRVI